MSKNKFVQNDSKWMLLDKTGKVLINYGNINAFTLLSVLVVNENGLFGLINLDGEFIQPCEYLSITQPFHNRGNENEKHEVLLLQDQKEKYWLCDKIGNIVTFYLWREQKVCKVAENVTLREGLNEDLVYIDEEIRNK